MDSHLNFESISNSAESSRYYSRVIDELKTTHGTLIDFGCGGGQLAVLASKSNRKVIGIDLDPPTLSKEQAADLSGNLEFVRGGLEQLDAILAKEDAEYLIFSNCIQYLNVCKVSEIIARHTSLEKVFISTVLNRYYWERLTGAVKQSHLHEVLRYALLLIKGSVIPYPIYAHSKREKPPSLRLIHSGMTAAGFALSNSFSFDIWGEQSAWVGNRDSFMCFLFEREK